MKILDFPVLSLFLIILPVFFSITQKSSAQVSRTLPDAEKMIANATTPVDSTRYSSIVERPKRKLEKLRKQISELRKHVGPSAVTTVLDKWGQFKALADSAVAVRQGITVDIIQMTHGRGMNVGGELGANARLSNTLTESILDTNKYRTVGLEGFMADSLTHTVLIENAKEFMSDKDFKIPTDSSFVIGLYMQNNGSFRYYNKHKKAVHLIGWESRPVYELSSQLENLDYSVALRIELIDIVGKLRDVIALSRVITTASQAGDSNPALVIGAEHGKHLYDLATKWGVSTRFFWAIDRNYPKLDSFRLKGPRD